MVSDLIDRKTVFDVIDKCILEKLEGDTVEIKESLKLITKIYRIPSAQPQRKTGEWIKEYWHSDKVRECSVCHVTQSVTTYRDKVNFNFCPYCGADMRRENDA